MADPKSAPPAILRRLVSMLYESLVAAAVLLIAFALPHIALGAFAQVQAPHVLVKVHFFVTLLLYFTWFWTHGGQTLPMKTWHIRVVDASGSRLRPAQAVLRYMAAWFSVLPLGIGLLWALVDRDRQFLHDRIAGTRLIVDR